jgi:Tol biopolymer transport system component
VCLRRSCRGRQPDGVGLYQLTQFPANDRTGMGSYSPDGKSIVFATSAGAVGESKPDIFVTNADGTNMRPITRTTNFEAGADWGPAPYLGCTIRA